MAADQGLSAESDGDIVFVPVVRDAVLTDGGTVETRKRPQLLPLPVVGGGAPITRH